MHSADLVYIPFAFAGGVAVGTFVGNLYCESQIYRAKRTRSRRGVGPSPEDGVRDSLEMARAYAFADLLKRHWKTLHQLRRASRSNISDCTHDHYIEGRPIASVSASRSQL